MFGIPNRENRRWWFCGYAKRRIKGGDAADGKVDKRRQWNVLLEL